MLRFISRQFRLFRACLSIELMDRMEDARVFWLMSIGAMTRVAISVIFFEAIYAHTSSLGGWSEPQVLILVGTYELIVNVSWATYARGLWHLPRLIERGLLDTLLVQPVGSVLVFITYRYIDALFGAPPVLVALGIIAYGGMQIGSMAAVPAYILTLLLAFILHFALYTIIMSVNFYRLIPQSTTLIEQVTKLGRYPISIYRGTVRTILSFVVPLAFIYSVPAETLAGGITSQRLLLDMGLALGAIILASTVWKSGIHHYESTGS